MDPEAFSVANAGRAILLSLFLCIGTLVGCSGSSNTSVLSEENAKRALQQLPYRFKFEAVDIPSGAVGAVAGQATGPHETVVHFGIALGDSPDGVPVRDAGVFDSFGYPEGGFLFTSDLSIGFAEGSVVTNPRYETAKQWSTAIEMEVEMTDRLCKAATGEPCPV